MSYPKCPICGYEFSKEDIWYDRIDNFPTEDGDHEDIKCPNSDCGRLLEVNCCYEPGWSVEISKNDEIEKKEILISENEQIDRWDSKDLDYVDCCDRYLIRKKTHDYRIWVYETSHIPWRNVKGWPKLDSLKTQFSLKVWSTKGYK